VLTGPVSVQGVSNLPGVSVVTLGKAENGAIDVTCR
jgi:hypothetical protein